MICEYRQMLIEDIIIRMGEYGFAGSSYDRKFIRSLSRRINDDIALTTKQGWAVTRMLKNCENLEETLNLRKGSLKEILDNPQWRKPLIPSVELRPQVRHLGDNILAFRSSVGKRFETRVSELGAVFSHGMKLVPVTSRKSLDAVIEIIGEFGFEYDEATEKYLADALERHGEEPRVAALGGKIVFEIPNHEPIAQFVHHVLGADYL